MGSQLTILELFSDIPAAAEGATATKIKRQEKQFIGPACDQTFPIIRSSDCKGMIQVLVYVVVKQIHIKSV